MSATASELTTVQSVDIAKYLGTWQEIARFENKHQQGCIATQAMYTQKKGYIEIKNTCTKADGSEKEVFGRAKIADATNAKLTVNFTPLFIRMWGIGWGNYWIIDLGPNYEYAVVSEPKKESLWILSRQKPMTKARYDEIAKRLQEKGFDVSKLIVSKDAIAAE